MQREFLYEYTNSGYSKETSQMMHIQHIQVLQRRVTVGSDKGESKSSTIRKKSFSNSLHKKEAGGWIISSGELVGMFMPRHYQ